MRVNPRDEAVRLLGGLDEETVALLREKTVDALTELIGLRVEPREPTPPSDGCPIDGTYHPGPPARIRYARDTTPSRQRFTLLHEFGHHLIEHDDHLNDLDVDDGDRRDEEICNEVAASILIPEALVEELLPRGSFTAQDVVELHERTHASRMACCVAAVRRLSNPGAVILGSGQTAAFAAHHPATPWRVARDTDQGGASQLAAVSRATRRSVRGVTRVGFANGNISSELFGDTHCAEDGWIFQVVVADTHNPWERGLRLDRVDAFDDDDHEFECPICDDTFISWEAPCRRCGDRRCPRCGKCGCQPSRITCTGPCGMSLLPQLFSPGSTVCRDCAG